jgi:glycosyltransferase involved in cell wall biosynthesis
MKSKFSHLKLLHINSYYITNKLHSELVKKLDEKGFTQTVFIPIGEKKQIGINKIKGLNNTKLIYDHCFNTFTRYFWPIKMMQIWFALKRTTKTIEKPNVIHAHSLIVNGLPAWYYSKKERIPFVVTIRNTDINIFLKKSRFFRKIGERILKDASDVIFLSAAYRDTQLKKHISSLVFNDIYAKTHVVPNGINDFWIKNKTLKPHVISSSEIKVLFAGKLSENKNLKGLIEACKLLHKNGKNIILNIVGDGPLFEKLKSQTYPFTTNFYGFISDKKSLLEIYRMSDIMVVPSFRESFGLIYAEAITQGLPVIYTKGQGFDGYFKNGYVGYAVNANDINDIAEKIELCINSYSILASNTLKATSAFSWENVVAKLTSIYLKKYEYSIYPPVL